MHQIGEKVIYGSHGVCVVAGQETRIFDKREVTYLVLEPANQSGSRFLVPAHNEAAMRKLNRILSREEWDILLSPERIQGISWIPEEPVRKQLYRDLIGSGDRQKILAMIYMLYRHKQAQHSAGKKIHLCDENFLRDAEKLMISELSVVMEISAEDARRYLKAKLLET